MRNKVILLMLVCTAGVVHGQKEYLENVRYITQEMVEDMSVVFENGETIGIQESYESVKSKDIPILKEVLNARGSFEHRVMIFEDFEVLFDRVLKVRNIYSRGSNSNMRLLNGIYVGQPIEEIFRKYEKDTQYDITRYDKNNFFLLGYPDKHSLTFWPDIAFYYSDDRKVNRIYIGFVSGD